MNALDAREFARGDSIVTTHTKIACALTALICLTTHAADPKLPASDIERGRLYLEQTRTGVIGATRGLTDAQWKFKPNSTSWSIAEIVEHIVLAQDLVLGPVREQLAKAPAAPNRDAANVDALLLARMPDRTVKFQAPDPVQPSGRWTPAVAMDRMTKNFDRMIEYLQSTPDLRQHVIDAAPLKAISQGAYESMDGYEWLIAIAAHAERHTKQILEVKAAAAFPVH
jgi:hypothetical protein